jgi:hypothetical protein
MTTKQTAPVVSPHLVRVFDVVKSHGGWLPVSEIAGRASVAKRTCNNHATLLTRLGIFDRAAVFPGFRYRASTSGGDPATLAAIEEARSALGA